MKNNIKDVSFECFHDYYSNDYYSNVFITIIQKKIVLLSFIVQSLKENRNLF